MLCDVYFIVALVISTFCNIQIFIIMIIIIIELSFLQMKKQKKFIYFYQIKR